MSDLNVQEIRTLFVNFLYNGINKFIVAKNTTGNSRDLIITLTGQLIIITIIFIHYSIYMVVLYSFTVITVLSTIVEFYYGLRRETKMNDINIIYS